MHASLEIELIKVCKTFGNFIYWNGCLVFIMLAFSGHHHTPFLEKNKIIGFVDAISGRRSARHACMSRVVISKRQIEMPVDIVRFWYFLVFGVRIGNVNEDEKQN